ncbi:hypothetical protein HUU59_09290 [bacterium]|nr:hypothetical protein [bacterium]
MSDQVKSYTNWKSLPPLGGGVWVAMVTEVLDNEEIPNIVKTDLASGGLGVVTGTETLGKAWRIQVPEEYYTRALEIHDSILGGDHTSEPAEEVDDPSL